MIARNISTVLVNAGRNTVEQFGFVNPPVVRGSTVLSPTMKDLKEHTGRYHYGTLGTPTTESLERAWTEISGSAGTVLAPSGLAAVTLALLTCLKSGDHLLITDSVYQPTRDLCDKLLKPLGIQITYFDALIGAGIADLMRPNTTAIFTESPGSQTFEVLDIPAIAAVAHAHGAVLLLDNTWATPLLFPPHLRGVDIAIEAGTKYLGGHSDILLGLVTANDAWFPRLRSTYELISMCPGPEDVFLALRGLRTLAMRLSSHGAAALSMARWLEARSEVHQVLHPALESHPGHEIWKRDFHGASGLFSVVLQPATEAAVASFLDGLELFGMGYSWGGFESLVIPFDCKSTRTARPWAPVGPTLRFHIGHEHLDDLKSDLEAGFERLRSAAE